MIRKPVDAIPKHVWDEVDLYFHRALVFMKTEFLGSDLFQSHREPYRHLRFHRFYIMLAAVPSQCTQQMQEISHVTNSMVRSHGVTELCITEAPLGAGWLNYSCPGDMVVVL